VCLSASGLAVAESCGAETFHCHLDEPFDSRKLKYVFLRGSGFENYIVGKHSGLGVTCTHRTKLERGFQDTYRHPHTYTALSAIRILVIMPHGMRLFLYLGSNGRIILNGC
jgi:hypothetical protein